MKSYTIHCEDHEDLQKTLSLLGSIGAQVSSVDGLAINGEYDGEAEWALINATVVRLRPE
jgi:hypothetical protein